MTRSREGRSHAARRVTKRKQQEKSIRIGLSIDINGIKIGLSIFMTGWWFGTWLFFPFHIWDNPSH